MLNWNCLHICNHEQQHIDNPVSKGLTSETRRYKNWTIKPLALSRRRKPSAFRNASIGLWTIEDTVVTSLRSKSPPPDSPNSERAELNGIKGLHSHFFQPLEYPQGEPTASSIFLYNTHTESVIQLLNRKITPSAYHISHSNHHRSHQRDRSFKGEHFLTPPTVSSIPSGSFPPPTAASVQTCILRRGRGDEEPCTSSLLLLWLHSLMPTCVLREGKMRGAWLISLMQTCVLRALTSLPPALTSETLHIPKMGVKEAAQSRKKGTEKKKALTHCSQPNPNMADAVDDSKRSNAELQNFLAHKQNQELFNM
ncbi:uncharacterized protein LOC130367386 [Hyla sarda]|uniref:uncharacterized protein LOC130367386 n=1 Tax=Hyla sarda TaxID=327740 RepID=UPI0024C2AAF7|nr:uncharacterized protein LOC130367386 [Hyla sarda]